MTLPDDVRSTIGAVRDPELHATLDTLGAIRSVSVTDGVAEIEVAVIVHDTPRRARLQDLVESAASGVAGVDRAEVRLGDSTPEERSTAVAAMKSAPRVGAPGSRTRVLSISSGKGGVGKSSVTTNLAVALAEAGHLVAVIDADVWGFSIPKMLGVDGTPMMFEEAILPPQAYGVRAMSMEYFVPDDRAVIWRGPMLHKALDQFLSDVLWGEPDFLLLDLPPGTGDVAISLSQFVPTSQAIIVTTPQPTAQRVAKRAGLMAEKVGQEILGVVENMSWFTGNDGTQYELFGAGGGQSLATELGTELLGTVPLVPAMREGADAGRPVLAAAPTSEAAEAFRAIAAEVVARRPRVRTHPELVVR